MVNVSSPAPDSPGRTGTAELQLHPAGGPAQGRPRPGGLQWGSCCPSIAHPPAWGGLILSFGSPSCRFATPGSSCRSPWAGSSAQSPTDPCRSLWHPTKGGAIAPSCASVNFCMAGSHGQRIPPDFPFLHISTVHYFPSSMR